MRTRPPPCPGPAPSPISRAWRPRAYIGNYKVLGTPTPDAGPDGNSAEIVAGIEAAVSDGMDVFNLSLGEPEIEPSRDIVTKAIDAAAAAGVVPVVAAGNDSQRVRARLRRLARQRGEGDHGRRRRRGRQNRRLLVVRARAGLAAHEARRERARRVRSCRPCPLRRGAGRCSAARAWPPPRRRRGRRAPAAAPRVVGGPDQVGARPDGESGASSTAVRLPRPGRAAASSTCPRADNPLLFASPTGLSFGLLRPDTTARQTVKLTDAGGGAGPWSATVQQQSSTAGVRITVPATVTVPGTFAVRSPSARPPPSAT